ncbi:MAG TPA: hypothetical protein VIN06_18600 [Devosia sp.]
MPHKRSDPLDDTEHGPVPNFQPNPVAPDPGREPIPNPRKPGDSVVVPPARDPFPEPSPEPDRRPM